MSAFSKPRPYGEKYDLTNGVTNNNIVLLFAKTLRRSARNGEHRKRTEEESALNDERRNRTKVTEKK